MMPRRRILLTGVHLEGKIMKAQASPSLTHFPNRFSLWSLCRSVPKFMKRMKVPDYKEKSVFGVPLILHVQRCGFPLPPCLQQALSHLRTHCLDQVGRLKKSLDALQFLSAWLIFSFMFFLRSDCSVSLE